MLLGLVAAVALAITAVGCGDEAGNEPAPAPDVETITYSKTGGIAGVSERLVIEPDGAAVLKVGYMDPAVVEFDVPEAQLEELTETFDEVGFSELQSPTEDSGCADCFLYDVTLGDQSVAGDDINVGIAGRPSAPGGRSIASILRSWTTVNPAPTWCSNRAWM
jgi:hypothetical protein